MIADESYAFAAAGNRTDANGTAVTTTDDNRLTDDGTYTYTYDDEGNRTGRTDAAGNTVTYTYDHRNRLTAVVFKNDSGVTTSQARYTYDPNDLRIATEIDADGDGTYESVERFVLDGDAGCH